MRSRRRADEETSADFTYTTTAEEFPARPIVKGKITAMPKERFAGHASTDAARSPLRVTQKCRRFPRIFNDIGKRHGILTREYAGISTLPSRSLQNTQDNVSMFRYPHHHHRTNPRSRMHPAGLTLIEVLVVIVIIAVLAAISFPIVRGMRERAESAQCVQNLRQIGIGLLGYISENNGRFPDGSADVSWAPAITTTRVWYDAAAENMGREYVPFHKGDPLPEVFGCPSGHGKAYEPAWPYTGDYAVNFYLGHPNHKVTTISAVNQPSSTPFVQDTVKQNNFGTGIYGSGFPQTANSSFAARHRGTGNILWVDGHVSSLAHAAYMALAKDPKRGGVYNFVRGNW